MLGITVTFKTSFGPTNAMSSSENFWGFDLFLTLLPNHLPNLDIKEIQKLRGRWWMVGQGRHWGYKSLEMTLSLTRPCMSSLNRTKINRLDIFCFLDSTQRFKVARASGLFLKLDDKNRSRFTRSQNTLRPGICENDAITVKLKWNCQKINPFILDSLHEDHNL